MHTFIGNVHAMAESVSAHKSVMFMSWLSQLVHTFIGNVHVMHG